MICGSQIFAKPRKKVRDPHPRRTRNLFQFPNPTSAQDWRRVHDAHRCSEWLDRLRANNLGIVCEPLLLGLSFLEQCFDGSPLCIYRHLRRVFPVVFTWTPRIVRKENGVCSIVPLD